MGREVFDSLVREFGVVDDPPTRMKLQAMMEYLASVSRAPVEPQIAVLNRLDVNALALPGGFFFVTKGLLDYVESDDELAAVLAHEMAHVVKKHTVQILERDRRVAVQTSLWALALSLLLGRAEDTPYFLHAAEVVRIAKASGFTQKAEREADAYGVELLRRTPYSPYGALLFLEKLHVQDERGPAIDWGILQTHPSSAERVETLRRLLKRDPYPYHLWEKQHFHLGERDGAPVLYFGREPLLRLREAGGFDSAQQRGLYYAAFLNHLIQQGVDFRNVQAQAREGHAAWVFMQNEILRVYPGEELEERARPEPDTRRYAQENLQIVQRVFVRRYLEKFH